MSLLVVDDDPIILELLEGILTSLGYRDVHYASNGEEALDLVARGIPVSTFLLDIQMPGIDGLGLCRALRASDRHRRTPIVMLTSLTDKAFIDAAFTEGATDYINKPIEVRELGTRLRVAQMLHFEQQSAADAHRLAQAMGDTSGLVAQIPPFEFVEPIEIRDVPRVLSAVAMENYLHRLSRVRRFLFAAVGFRLHRAESLHMMLSPAEFQAVLTDVADAIFETLRGHDVMISYCGSGEFVAVLPRVAQVDCEEIEVMLALKLNEFGLTIEGGLPMNLSVAVGEHVQSSMFTTDPVALIEKAISRLDGRPRRPGGSPQHRNRMS